MSAVVAATRVQSVLASDEAQWTVVDWLNEYLGLDLIAMWERRAEAPNIENGMGAQAFAWLNEAEWPLLLFGDRWEVLGYGSTRGVGEGRFIEIGRMVVAQLCGIWEIDVVWPEVAGALPDSQTRLVDDFYKVYRSCVISLGSKQWATFNGLYFVRDGSGGDETGIQAVLARLKAQISALQVAAKLASEWVSHRAAELVNGGAAPRAAAATAREPFDKFFKLMDGVGDNRFESGILSMLERRSISSAGMNGVAAQGSLTLLNGHFYLTDDGLQWSSQRSPQLSELKNDRVINLTWPGPDGPVTPEQLFALWSGSRWARFLDDSIPLELHRLRLAMSVGDSLFGVQKAKMITLVVGQKDSGKSLLLELIAEILGAYAAAMPEEMMMSSRRGMSDRFVLEPVRGRRFGTVSEGEEGQTLNAVVLKRLTGRDSVASRDLNKSYSDLKPEVSLFLGTNEEPASMAQDQALAERLLRIQTALRPGVVKDPKLPGELRAGDGKLHVLAWALWGAIAPETMELLEKFRQSGAAEEGVESVMSGSDSRINAVIECIKAGMLVAVGDEDEWEDWRRVTLTRGDGGAHDDAVLSTRPINVHEGEHVCGATGVGVVKWLRREHMLSPRMRREEAEVGASMDEVMGILQAFTADPNNREKFNRSGDRVLWGSKNNIQKLIAMYFGGARRGSSGLRVMGLEVRKNARGGRF